jgi:hypothetical protein
MALVALVGKNRPDLTVEIDLTLQIQDRKSKE